MLRELLQIGPGLLRAVRARLPQSTVDSIWRISRCLHSTTLTSLIPVGWNASDFLN